MPATLTTRAINRALTYAIESAEGDSQRILAIRRDLEDLLASGANEVRIIATLSRIPIRIAQMRELEALTAKPDDAIAALEYAVRLRLQIDAGEYKAILR